jgi:hypothetical protein
MTPMLIARVVVAVLFIVLALTVSAIVLASLGRGVNFKLRFGKFEVRWKVTEQRRRTTRTKR